MGKKYFAGATIIKKAFLISSFYFLLCPLAAQEAGKLSDSSIVKWRQDLSFLSTNMDKYHKNLYHTVSKKAFDSSVQSLYARIPGLQRHEIIVEIMKLAAMINDGHTNVNPARDPKIGFRTLPVKFYLFSDGLFIRTAAKSYASLTGKQVISFDGMPVAEVLKRVSPVVSKDNEIGEKQWAAIYLSMPEVLHALGVVKNMESVSLKLRSREGKEEMVKLAPYELADIMRGEIDLNWQLKDGWVDMRESSHNPTPLWLQAKPGNKYWLQYLPDSKIVYVQLNEIGTKDSGQEQVTDFYKRIFRTADSVKADKLVIDLRLNGGGNGFYNKPLFIGLLKSKMDEKGRVFCITNRRTFSAAEMLVSYLAQYTNVLFVGEPAGSKQNIYGDSYKIVLPNSGITARVSTLWHQTGHPKDTDPFIPVDIPVGLSSTDYANNRDAALTAVIQYKPSPGK